MPFYLSALLTFAPEIEASLMLQVHLYGFVCTCFSSTWLTLLSACFFFSSFSQPQLSTQMSHPSSGFVPCILFFFYVIV